LGCKAGLSPISVSTSACMAGSG